MQKLLKIDCITYKVKNPKKAAGFYSDVLGLERVWDDPKAGMIGFKFAKSDTEIVLHNDPKIPNYDFSFLVNNVEKFCEEFKKKGYKISGEPFDVRCGKYAILLDPDDNVIPIIDLTKFSNKPKYNKQKEKYDKNYANL